MIGLMILMFFVVYLLVSIFVTTKAVSWAKANNKRPWVWGGLAAFVMYNLVFWDLIPTLIAHKYYCATQAGFWVYKTPEQWMKENPELTAEDLKPLGIYEDGMLVDFPYQSLIKSSQKKVQMLNKKVYLDSDYQWDMFELLPIKINKLTDFIATTDRNQKLASFVDFSSGYGNPMTTGKGLYAWKFWLAGNCYGSNTNKWEITGYNDYIKQIIELGK